MKKKTQRTNYYKSFDDFMHRVFPNKEYKENNFVQSDTKTDRPKIAKNNIREAINRVSRKSA